MPTPQLVPRGSAPYPHPTCDAKRSNREGYLKYRPGNSWFRAGLWVPLSLAALSASAAILQEAYLKAFNPGSSDRLGGSIAMSGDTLVVGAPGEASDANGLTGNGADNSAPNAGAVYVFSRSGDGWVQQAYIKAPSSDAQDAFGSAVALSEDTLVVGAPFEDGVTTGINGNPDDNAAMNSGAAYVFVRQGSTWTLQAYLKASNSEALDEFGSSVSVSGDTLVVGAPFEAGGAVGSPDPNALPRSGAAYVFTRSGTTWSQQAYLKAQHPGTSDGFGRSVAVSGDRIAIGAPFEDSGTPEIDGVPSTTLAEDSGAAYVFERSGTTWHQRAYLKALSPIPFQWLGTAVALEGGTVVAGCPNADAGMGLVQVFRQEQDRWSHQATLSPKVVGVGNRFGSSVAIRAGRILVGAPEESGGEVGVNGDATIKTAPLSGAGYLFTTNAGGWNQVAYIKAGNAERLDSFGISVALGEDQMALGAWGEDGGATHPNGNPCDNSVNSSGAAYVFQLDSADTAIARVTVESPLGQTLSPGSAVLDFGALSPNDLVQRTLHLRNTGVATVTGLSATIEGPAAPDFAIINSPGSRLGGPCGLASLRVVFRPRQAGAKAARLRLSGSPGEGLPFEVDLRGMAVPNSVNVIPVSTVLAANVETGDRGGHSVAISGNTLVIGAPGEDSAATGVDGNASNNGAPGSGAAYVYVWDGAAWVQQAYLKASNVETGDDQFGHRVAISGDILAVSAVGEDGSQRGINPTADNSATRAGAVYVFSRSGTQWAQQAYLKASNAGEFQNFGVSIALSGETLIVGADGEKSSATGVDGPQNNQDAVSSGAAYVFIRTGSTWSQQAYIKASDTSAFDSFGKSVAIDGDTAVVGAESASNENSGVAYVFARHNTTWTQEAYLKSIPSSVGQAFGASVAVSRDTIVVGAPRETGPIFVFEGRNPEVGAAYVFVRNGSSWSPQARLRASYSHLWDNFGQAVTIDGDRIWVGAPGEDGAGRGVSADPLARGSTDSGAAYLFVRVGDAWIQQAYLKPQTPTSTEYHHLGEALASDGEWVAFGIPGFTTVGSESGAADVYRALGSVPLLALDASSPGKLRLRLVGNPGQTYRLERGPSLSGPWERLQRVTAPSSGQAVFEELPVIETTGFYRAAPDN